MPSRHPCTAAHHRFALHHLAGRVWLTTGGQAVPSRQGGGSVEVGTALRSCPQGGGRELRHLRRKNGGRQASAAGRRDPWQVREAGCSGDQTLSAADSCGALSLPPAATIRGRCNKYRHCGFREGQVPPCPRRRGRRPSPGRHNRYQAAAPAAQTSTAPHFLHPCGSPQLRPPWVYQTRMEK